MSRLGYHAKQFSNKVRAMNQMGKPNLILSADEARNLLHDIVDLESKIIELVDEPSETTTVVMNGPKF